MAKRKNVGSIPIPAVDRAYQAEDDHRVLTKALEIQSDVGRMAGVRRHHRKQTRTLSSLGKSFRGLGSR